MNFSDLVEILSQVQASAPSWLQYYFMLCVRACQFSVSLLWLDVFANVLVRPLLESRQSIACCHFGGLLSRNFP